MCVRSSIAFYGNFNLDMGRSPGFGSTYTDSFALLRLGFPSAPPLNGLTLPVNVTRRTVLQKVRGCTYKVLPQFVNTGFQVLFHSPPGVLFTFPSQYYSLSVTKEYLALRSGLRLFPQGFPCLVVLWILLCIFRFRVRDFHPVSLVFPVPFYYQLIITFAVRTPKCTHLGLGSFHFARRYFGNRISFFSSGYLDVSVHRVPGHNLWIQLWSHEGCSCRFPHSDIYGSRNICFSP